MKIPWKRVKELALKYLVPFLVKKVTDKKANALPFQEVK